MMSLIPFTVFTAITLACCSSVSGFNLGTAFGVPKLTQNPSLLKFTDDQSGTLLNIRMDIGATVNDEKKTTNNGDFSPASRFAITGLEVQLQEKDADAYPHPKMPGVDGPHPELSSGARALNLLQFGSFISMNGLEQVELENGCWEMVWRDGAPAGSLVCGFDLLHEAKRNDASLTPGKVYMTFPIWTEEGLTEAQDIKKQKEAIFKKHLDEKDLQLEMMQETSNVLMKALHYRNAAAAAEKMWMTDLKNIKMVPSNDEVIHLEKNGLLLTTKGLVWRKEEKAAFKPADHTLLGTAIITPSIV
eukprot:scaffold24007_cov49-Attheya_sp.AAC.3